MIKSGVKIELLAPAKDKNTAISAINAGADAVYIGFSKFGARAAAGNSLEDIANVVEYANIYRVSVYVTLNTIYTDEELPEVIKIIYKLYDIGVSAIIIQDMGILNSKLPPIRIFASTQCHNNSLEKVKFLEKIGIERIILPREFSLSEIKNITENTNIEVETFVHGALCVSYSGQCYLSCAIGGRSANRGECAQPCRKKYTLKSNDGKIIAKDKYLLSMKDLNLSNHIKDLILAGVTSFKIEGRLKDEGYVKNVVSYYRQKIDKVIKELNLEKSSVGISSTDYIPDVNKSFNRGFTDFFIDGKRKNFCTVDYAKSIGEAIGSVKACHKNYFTLNKPILTNGDGICFFDEKKELCGTKIIKTENDKIFPQSMQGIKKGVKIFRNYDAQFNKKINSKEPERKIGLSATIYINNKSVEIILSDKENISVKVTYNDIFKPAKNKTNSENSIKENLSKLGGTEFYIQSYKLIDKIGIFIPASILNNLRRQAIEKIREERKKQFIRKKRTNNITLSNYPIKELNYKANIYNSKARNFYKDCGTNVLEQALEQSHDFKNKELMVSKHCIKYTLGICKKHFKNVKDYKEPLLLTDEKHKKYILIFDCKNCLMKVKSL